MLKHIQAREEWSEKSVADKGFTLIELLVVIAILGVLAVVGVLAFGGLTDTAKHATARTEQTQVQAAVDAYNAQHNAYPADVAALQADTPPKLKAGVTLQCLYTIDGTTGDVTFQALAAQTDKTCHPGA